MDELLRLILENAQGRADISGKTELDAYLEASKDSETEDIADLLRTILPKLDESEWRQWRAFRQIVGRLRLKSDQLRNDLAIMTEDFQPKDSQSRFYAYLARTDLSDAPSMEELLEDRQFRNERPGDWLQLALTQASPSSFRTETLKLANKLRANDFIFKLVPLREKYDDKFVDWMTELCLAMQFSEGLELASFLDDEFHCGIHSEVLANHNTLKPNHPPVSPVVVPEIWRDLDPQFKTSILEKA